MVILPRRHPLADRPRLSMNDLEQERFILGTESGWQEFRQYIFNICLQAGYTPQVVQEASTSSGIFGLVAANMGISLYSECIKNFQREDIAIVPLDNEGFTVETIAAWSQSYINPSARIFLDLLEVSLGQ